MRLNGECVYVTFPGALNGDIFKLYIEKILAPTLRLGDIVVMDSLSSHKAEGIKDMIHRTGAYVLFQPRYSPDLNPVEQLWSKIKTFLRKAKARSTDLLLNAISDAFSSVSSDDISSWFDFTGYSVPFLSTI
jgi:transposase